MIHHYSIPVLDTLYVSEVFAYLFNGTITKFGPYDNSYIVWLGDEFGSAIEFYPLGTELLPDQGHWHANFIHNEYHTGFSGTHAAISINRSRDEILSVAKAENWKAVELPRGGFNVIEFWIENRVMVELITPDMLRDYLAATMRFRNNID